MKILSLILVLAVSFGSEAQNTTTPAAESTYEREGDHIRVTHFHENGQVRETGYFLGTTPDGKWETFDENGNKTAELNYRNGKRHGEFRVWDGFTDSYTEIRYKDGAVLAADRYVRESGFARSED
jgi:antitoxin component YwqK of YwqJK toxin-antitoxin module